MPIAAGSFAMKRFQILSNSKEISIPWILERVQKHFISPINLEDTREEAIGFCHPFTGEPRIENPHSLIYENMLLFGMREDKKKISATYMKLQLRAALEALGHEKENSQGIVKKVGKKIKDSVKDKLREELIRSTLPSVKLVEILWHLNTNQVWLMSTSPSVVAEFEKLFASAFALPLIYLNAGTAAIDFESIQLGLKVNLSSYLDVSPVSLSSSNSKINLKNKDLQEEISPF